jgi:hypothetical protein
MIFSPATALRRYRERQRAASPHPPLRVLLWSELRALARRLTGRR